MNASTVSYAELRTRLEGSDRPLSVDVRPAPSFREALRFWLRLGFISFGGPAGQIAILHREVVERRKWLSEERFASGLAFCTFLPGPEAQQLATYIGRSLHGLRGGLAAGILFFLPASLLLLGLSFLRAEYGTLPVVAATLRSLRPVVVAIILDAALRMAGKRLFSKAHALLAMLALFAALLPRVPFPWIVGAAALLGLLVPDFLPREPREGGFPEPLLPGREVRRAAIVLSLGLILWLAPIVSIRALASSSSLFEAEYLFFSKAALVTFGGAYSVLSYVSQAAVDHFHWLSRAEVMDGLALAETTPGPLIIVVQYVGFLAGWNHPRELDPLLSGAMGALVTTYATFLPSLVLVFLGAPYVDRIAAIPRLAGGLGAIGAAVTGVVFSLGMDYGWVVIFPAGFGSSPDPFALAVLLAAFLSLWRAKVDLIPVLLAGALAGPLLHFLRG